VDSATAQATGGSAGLQTPARARRPGARQRGDAHARTPRSELRGDARTPRTRQRSRQTAFSPGCAPGLPARQPSCRGVCQGCPPDGLLAGVRAVTTGWRGGSATRQGVPKPYHTCSGKESEQQVSVSMLASPRVRSAAALAGQKSVCSECRCALKHVGAGGGRRPRRLRARRARCGGSLARRPRPCGSQRPGLCRRRTGCCWPASLRSSSCRCRPCRAPADAMQIHTQPKPYTLPPGQAWACWSGA